MTFPRFVVFALASLSIHPAMAAECDDLRGQIENFWRVEKGTRSEGFNLRPLALETRSPTTTMPQMAMVCRKDTAGGSVSLFGDETRYNDTLSPDECRLVFLLGVEKISAEAGDDLNGTEACGSFDIIR
jgi:hypothetical protein